MPSPRMTVRAVCPRPTHMRTHLRAHMRAHMRAGMPSRMLAIPRWLPPSLLRGKVRHRLSTASQKAGRHCD